MIIKLLDRRVQCQLQRRFLPIASKFEKWVVNMSPFTVNNLINLNILRFYK